MPRALGGKPIDPTEWNRQDGFSPGSMVLTYVPGLDLHQTWGTEGMSTGGANDPADQIADISRYTRPDAPIVLIDQQTGQRWPFWSELDQHPATPDDKRLLIIRPAVNLPEGHTILVGLRNLRDAEGQIIPASPAFAAYRDNTAGPVGDPTFEETRRAEIGSIIGSLQAAEPTMDTGELYLAWKFTVASGRNLTERVLRIRDDAFAQLGDTDLADGKIAGVAPRFTITGVKDLPGDRTKIRQVDGTITVPNYLNGDPQYIGPEYLPVSTPLGNPNQALTGDRFLYGPDGLPMQNPLVPTIDVNFVCTIPRPDTARLGPSVGGLAHPMLYGHGLLGSRNEATGGSTERDRERNFMPCAVNWMGFAGADFANAVRMLVDPSHIASVADRSQQGFLNFLYLGRALAHPRGLITSPAFQADGLPLFKTNELFYDGNSQGGIMGGALTALMVDGPQPGPGEAFTTRSVLGVPGMNYSTLLNRSVDFEGGAVSYSTVLYTSFPDKMEQQLVMGLMQMLWDRFEGNGYAQHMTTDPLPNTPPHQVLMHVAVGDYQVTNVSAEVQARTIGAPLIASSSPVRPWQANFPWSPTGGMQPVASSQGSAFVYWDSGNRPPPNANIPPSEDGQTGDPHGDPRNDPRASDQKAAFWLTGDILDVMAGADHPYGACRPGAQAKIPRAPEQGFVDDWCTAETLAPYGF